MLESKLPLTSLEKAVLDLLLKGSSFDDIRKQLEYASVIKREFTGVGFFTEFLLPDDAPVRRDLLDGTLGDVYAKFPGLKQDAGFLLFIRDGAISLLEGFTYDEPWPANTSEFKLYKRST